MYDIATLWRWPHSNNFMNEHIILHEKKLALEMEIEKDRKLVQQQVKTWDVWFGATSTKVTLGKNCSSWNRRNPSRWPWTGPNKDCSEMSPTFRFRFRPPPPPNYFCNRTFSSKPKSRYHLVLWWPPEKVWQDCSLQWPLCHALIVRQKSLIDSCMINLVSYY